MGSGLGCLVLLPAAGGGVRSRERGRTEREARAKESGCSALWAGLAPLRWRCGRKISVIDGACLVAPRFWEQYVRNCKAC